MYLELRPPRVQAKANRLMETAAHSSLNNFSPGTIVFNRDMYLDIPLIADIVQIHDLRQRGIDQRLLRENARRTHHDFCIGQQVYVKRGRTHGDQAYMRYDGPFPIVMVHANNTVTILRGNYHQRMTIRRVQLARR